MTTKKDTWFDAFFDAITQSPEFKTAMTKDWKKDSIEYLDNTIESMQKWVENAEKIMSEFNKNFATPEAIETGSKYQENTPKSTSISQTKEKEEDSEKLTIEIQRFKKTNEKMWGWNWVAGMDKLKKELSESFIRPLKFKFLIQELRTKKKEENWGQSQEKNTKKNDKKSKELLEKLYSEYEKFKISIPTGMLLYGPPGTGKTFITKKLAEEMNCGFVSKNMWEFGSSYLHQTTKNIKEFFDSVKKAAEKEPIIVFLDEIDSLVSTRGQNADAHKAEEVSQFLQEFNALDESENLIVIAATNRPDHLDSALLRSGRLDKKIYIWPPDFNARKELFQMYIEKKWRPHEALDYERLATLSEEYVSADIKAICEEAARDVSQKLFDFIDEAQDGTLTKKDLQGHKITMKLLENTIKETPSSLKVVDMSIYDNWLEKIS